MEDINESVELQVLAMAKVVDDTDETFGTVAMFKVGAALGKISCYSSINV